jgi:HEAT repeat protein/TolA-binding protein
MKNFTLMRLMIVGLAVPQLAAAQLPPVSPTPPTPPARAPRQPMQPIQPIQPIQEPLLPDFPRFELQKLNFEFDQMRLHDFELRAQDMALRAQEFANIDVERLNVRAEEMAVRAEQIAERALMDLPDQLFVPPGKLGELSSQLSGVILGKTDKLLGGRPRAAWSTDDPADSLYRVAREALNRGEYRRAAQLFNEITKKFPKSDYAQDCAYWEAFSRYRLGGTDDLKQALRILEGKGDVQIQFVNNPKESSVDVPALRARVQGALAARGDREAARALETEAKATGGCDREDIGVRAEALGALGQMDRAAAMPIVRKILANRDACTVELRRRALFVAARDADADAVTLIIDVAKNDTDQGVRSEAMRWLPRVAGDNAVPQLEDLLKSSTDEQTQRSAISALSSIDSDRARKAVRAIIERNDAGERVRSEAILSLSREREGRAVSMDDVNYLRSLYTKLESPRLREVVLTSVSRVETPENTQFLFGVVRNQSEATSLRATALQRLGRMSIVGLNDIAKLYDVADARSLREQILYALYQRKEPEAVDKLMEIARRDTDPQIRRTAVSLLARRNDPRAKQLLAELIEKP